MAQDVTLESLGRYFGSKEEFIEHRATDESRKTVCEVFSSVCDEKGIDPFKVGSEVSNLVHLIAKKSNAHIPDFEVLGVLAQGLKNFMSESVSDNDFVKRMFMGVLYDQLLAGQNDLSKFMSGLFSYGVK